jgi:cysteine desulfurase
LQGANNETGVLQPTREVFAGCRTAGVPLLVDAVQAAGKLELNAPLEGDLLAVSGHKLGGPQGTGALIVREGLALAPLIAGGAQERRRRGGTEATAAIAGFGAAADAAARSLRDDAARLTALRDRFEAGLRRQFPESLIHGADASRLPNTTNFAIPGVDGETLTIALDLRGFAVATGSACASGAVEPSHVIRAMGKSESEARQAVRVSTGWSSTEADIDALLDALAVFCDKVRCPGCS